ncbi:uncharacterized protein LOC122628314 isoform X2 [Vespula pensylvanica]|uniref:uncharacterized protein LOC122628314 isoform X2 n=1 Tax=Vespula pensylvanica TaxID=30213 RepID=UPI001CBA1199|nr:uncharacterized protein LOC122628314 isoform X2 [Vespula pensylvanica]
MKRSRWKEGRKEGRKEVNSKKKRGWRRKNRREGRKEVRSWKVSFVQDVVSTWEVARNDNEKQLMLPGDLVTHGLLEVLPSRRFLIFARVRRRTRQQVTLGLPTFRILLVIVKTLNASLTMVGHPESVFYEATNGVKIVLPRSIRQKGDTFMNANRDRKQKHRSILLEQLF